MIRKEDVPGQTLKDKVRYLAEQGKTAKEMSEILGATEGTIYNYRNKIKKENERNELTDPFASNEETPWELPVIPPYEEPTPVHIVEEKAPTFEITVDNMDGATVKALIAIANNKLGNEKTYKISLFIEEK